LVSDDGFMLDENSDIVSGSYTCNGVSMSDPVDDNGTNVFTEVNAANSVSGFSSCSVAQAAFTTAAGAPSGMDSTSYCDNLSLCSSPTYLDVNGVQVTFSIQLFLDGSNNMFWSFISPVCTSNSGAQIPVTWIWNNPGPYPYSWSASPSCDQAAANLATVNVCYET
jgi:hypothetical protein